jgi:hypothetical protein
MRKWLRLVSLVLCVASGVVWKAEDVDAWTIVSYTCLPPTQIIFTGEGQTCNDDAVNEAEFLCQQCFGLHVNGLYYCENGETQHESGAYCSS